MKVWFRLAHEDIHVVASQIERFRISLSTVTVVELCMFCKE